MWNVSLHLIIVLSFQNTKNCHQIIFVCHQLELLRVWVTLYPNVKSASQSEKWCRRFETWNHRFLTPSSNLQCSKKKTLGCIRVRILKKSCPESTLMTIKKVSEPWFNSSVSKVGSQIFFSNFLSTTLTLTGPLGWLKLWDLNMP